MLHFFSARYFLWLIVLGIALGLLLTSLSGSKLRYGHTPQTAFYNKTLINSYAYCIF